jgi:hypothetical protein
MGSSADRNHFFLTFACCMRFLLPIPILVLLLSGLPGCLFTDASIYEVEPVAGDPPVLTVSTNLDTLIDPPVNDSLEVIYGIEVSGGEFYYMYADVGPDPVYESDSTSGSFWVPTSVADSVGVDTLQLEIYYSTNSNSLADRVGYEARAARLKYPLYFNLGGRK